MNLPVNFGKFEFNNTLNSEMLAEKLKVHNPKNNFKLLPYLAIKCSFKRQYFYLTKTINLSLLFKKSKSLYDSNCAFNKSCYHSILL